MKKKILIIHNHKDFSGAARSIGELIENLKKKVDFIIISPRGTSSNYFKKINQNVFEANMIPRFNHFKIGYYYGFRWLLLLREIIAIIYFSLFLIKIKKNLKNIYSVHLNELELVILGPLIKLLFNIKITSHLRSLVENKKGKLRHHIFKKLCNKYINKIIAIDRDCSITSPCPKKTAIVHNGISKKNISAKNKKEKIVTFGFIGSFIKRKGIFDLLSVFKSLDKKKVNAKLICVGNKTKGNIILNTLRIEKNFEKFFIKEKLNSIKNIKILPMTMNLKNFYSLIDVIIFPSYMNAVGRPVIEAAFLKKPAIIGLKKYNNDTAIKNTCLIFKTGNLLSLEKKILYLIKNKSKIKKMGNKAFLNVKKNFDIKKNSIKFIKLLKI